MKKIKGSCLCKNIVFEIFNECRYSVLCHCTMCQKSNAEFSNYTKVKKENFKVIMTSRNCLTGTDRVAEVAKKMNSKIYINVQGDEPLIKPADIKKIIKLI